MIPGRVSRRRTSLAMQQRNNDTGVAAELQLVFSSQEKAPYFPDTAPQGEVRDEDEESLVEALIQAVLNSNTEAEPLDCVLVVVRTVAVHNRNSSLSN
jgi:hypothetical protein